MNLLKKGGEVRDEKEDRVERSIYCEISIMCSFEITGKLTTQ